MLPKNISITISEMTPETAIRILDFTKRVMSEEGGSVAATMETKSKTKKKKEVEADEINDTNSDGSDDDSSDNVDEGSDDGNDQSEETDNDQSEETDKDQDWEEFKEETKKVILDDVRIAFKNFVKKQTKKHKGDLKLGRKDAATILKKFKVASTDEMEKWPEKKLKEVIAAIDAF